MHNRVYPSPQIWHPPLHVHSLYCRHFDLRGLDESRAHTFRFPVLQAKMPAHACVCGSQLPALQLWFIPHLTHLFHGLPQRFWYQPNTEHRALGFWTFRVKPPPANQSRQLRYPPRQHAYLPQPTHYLHHHCQLFTCAGDIERVRPVSAV